MVTRFRKVYEIVGAQHDGTMWCWNHAPDEALDDDPVFLSEVEEGDICNVCHTPLNGNTNDEENDR